MKFGFEILYYVIVAIMYVALAVFYFKNNYNVAGAIWTVCAIGWIIKVGADILDMKKGDR